MLPGNKNCDHEKIMSCHNLKLSARRGSQTATSPKSRKRQDQGYISPVRAVRHAKKYFDFTGHADFQGCQYNTNQNGKYSDLPSSPGSAGGMVCREKFQASRSLERCDGPKHRTCRTALFGARQESKSNVDSCHHKRDMLIYIPPAEETQAHIL
jgi:hypothetical protein